MIIVLAVVIFRGLKQPGLTIQSFQVPKMLSESGLNGQVLGLQIKDKIEEIKQQVNSVKKDSTNLLAEVKPDLNLEVLGVGFSTNTLLFHLGDLLGIKNKTVTGDLIDLDDQFIMNLRGSDFSPITITQQHQGQEYAKSLDSLILKISLTILRKTDPYQLAVWYYKKNQDEQALELIREMIDTKHPDRAWAYLAWGSIYKKNQNFERAVEAYRKAINLKEDLTIGYLNLGWLLMEMKKYEEAFDIFEAGQKYEPHMGINNGLAQCYTLLGNVESAKSIYEKNIKEFPADLWAYGNYANFVLKVLGDTLASANIFKEAAKHVDKNSDYYTAMAAYYYSTNSYDSALVYLQNALEHNPENINALQIIADLTSTAFNDYHSTEKYLRQYIKVLQKGNHEVGMTQSAYNLLAMNDYRQEKYDSALIHAQKAIDLYPPNPYPFSTLAETYAYLKNHDLFYRSLEMALDRGFNLERFENEEPYSYYRHESRFQKLLEGRLKD